MSHYSVLILLLIGPSCDKVQNSTSLSIQTEHVLILIMDGARYSETWGDENHQFIPNISDQLAPEGIVNTSFRNMGQTLTVPGHTAITTGRYQAINNSGNQLPDQPSIFQYWREEEEASIEECWVIASKDKLDVLTDCENPDYQGHFRPSSDCGVDGGGLNSGYRNDSLTYVRAIEVLSDFHPKLMLVNFKEPDVIAHTGNWQGYLEGITTTDQYIYDLLEFIEDDPVYSGTTTVFVTNDHGRHLDDIGSGFSSHGDACEGCRHMLFYAYGPDFRKGEVIDVERSQIDITATVAFLLGIDMPFSEGEIMTELFY